MSTSSSQAKIVAVLTAREGKTTELQSLLYGMAPACRAEPGNLRWDIWRDPSTAKGGSVRFVLDELYVDAAAVAAHRETPHFKSYASKINDLAERTAYVLEPADLG